MPNKKKYKPEEYRVLFNSIFEGRFELLSDYTSIKDGVLVRHLSCKHEFKTNPDKAIIKKDIVCPKCDKRFTKAIPYLNDISVTNPEMVELLADKEDAHRYKAHSNKETKFICPVCGTSHIREINKVVSRGLVCSKCGNKSGSYAERFVASLFDQLEQDYNREFSPEWADDFRYDFMFSKFGHNYIVETDGGWHVEDNNLSGKTAEEQQETDKHKDFLAMSHDYIMIRLNYDYKNKNRDEVLINSILESQLSNIFDLSKVNFAECSYNALHCTIVKDVANTWLGGIRSCQQIADMLDISVGTVKSYLKLASNCGLINMSYDEIKKENRKYFCEVTHRKPLHDDEILELWNKGIYNFSEIARLIKSNHKSVKQAIQRLCSNGAIPYSYEKALKIKDEANPQHVGKHPQKVMCNETGEVFVGYSSANKKYGSQLGSYFYSNGKKCGGHLPDGTRLTWTKIEN